MGGHDRDPAATRMTTYLLIALGGALGSVGRYWAAELVARWMGNQFPYGTLLVNVTGSFLIGLFAAGTGSDGRWPASSSVRVFLMVGVCGGYTTFSSFSLQTLSLLREGRPLQAGLNILGSVALCLAAVWLGHLAAVGWPGRNG